MGRGPHEFIKYLHMHFKYLLRDSNKLWPKLNYPELKWPKMTFQKSLKVRSHIFLSQEYLFHPHITLKAPFSKLWIEKKFENCRALLSPGKIRRGRSPIKVAIEEKGVGVVKIEIKGVKGLEWLTKWHSSQRKCVM